MACGQLQHAVIFGSGADGEVGVLNGLPVFRYAIKTNSTANSAQRGFLLARPAEYCIVSTRLFPKAHKLTINDG